MWEGFVIEVLVLLFTKRYQGGGIPFLGMSATSPHPAFDILPLPLDNIYCIKFIIIHRDVQSLDHKNSSVQPANDGEAIRTIRELDVLTGHEARKQMV